MDPPRSLPRVIGDWSREGFDSIRISFPPGEITPNTRNAPANLTRRMLVRRNSCTNKSYRRPEPRRGAHCYFNAKTSSTIMFASCTIVVCYVNVETKVRNHLCKMLSFNGREAPVELVAQLVRPGGGGREWRPELRTSGSLGWHYLSNPTCLMWPHLFSTAVLV